MITRGKVLLAGPPDAAQQDLIEKLQQNGHQCLAAADRPQALELLAGSGFDLIVSQLHHNGQPDLAVARARDGVNQGIPVILLTATPSIESATEAIQLAVAAYLIKPCKSEDLLALIEQCISVGKSRRVCSDILERMENWSKDMGRLEKYLNAGTATPPDRVNMETFIPLTIGRILGSLMDLKALLDVASEKAPDHDPCHLLACPRLHACHEMIGETIGTLEKTKNYFKSRDLHELRIRLEHFLKNQLN